jgi:voltage-gated potassium channel
LTDETKKEQHAARQLRKDLWISALALVSVAIGVYDIARPRHTTEWRWYDVLDLLIVLFFVADFAWSAQRSGSWRTYAKKHWYEIPALIPITGNLTVGSGAIPLLRGLRLVRLVRALRLLRLVGTLGRMEKFWRRTFRIARRARLGKLALFALATTLLGAALAWLFESPSNERMASPANALWWAINMFTNVAYVDFQPATGSGRVVAAVLEVLGIAFIGLFTASIANALFREDEEEPPEDKTPLD